MYILSHQACTTQYLDLFLDRAMSLIASIILIRQAPLVACEHSSRLQDTVDLAVYAQPMKRSQGADSRMVWPEGGRFGCLLGVVRGRRFYHRLVVDCLERNLVYSDEEQCSRHAKCAKGDRSWYLLPHYTKRGDE